MLAYEPFFFFLVFFQDRGLRRTMRETASERPHWTHRARLEYSGTSVIMAVTMLAVGVGRVNRALGSQ